MAITVTLSTPVMPSKVLWQGEAILSKEYVAALPDAYNNYSRGCDVYLVTNNIEAFEVEGVILARSIEELMNTIRPVRELIDDTETVFYVDNKRSYSNHPASWPDPRNPHKGYQGLISVAKHPVYRGSDTERALQIASSHGSVVVHHSLNFSGDYKEDILDNVYVVSRGHHIVGADESVLIKYDPKVWKRRAAIKKSMKDRRLKNGTIEIQHVNNVIDYLYEAAVTTTKLEIKQAMGQTRVDKYELTMQLANLLDRLKYNFRTKKWASLIVRYRPYLKTIKVNPKDKIYYPRKPGWSPTQDITDDTKRLASFVVWLEKELRRRPKELTSSRRATPESGANQQPTEPTNEQASSAVPNLPAVS